MIAKIRYKFLKFFKPVIMAIGRFHLPGTKREITEADVMSCLDAVETGDVILSRKDWELTNLFIEGDFKHAGIVTVVDIIEAVAPVARRTGFFDFMMKSDAIVVCRPIGFDENELHSAIQYATRRIGLKYDYFFVEGNEENYCSELCYEALTAAKSNWGFVRRKIMGKYTVQPDDFRLAKKYFRVVWASDKKYL